MKTYSITINEYQRLMLVEALEDLGRKPGLIDQPGDDSTVCPEPSRLGECNVLGALFTDLPQLERDDPGANHGFCY